MIDQHSISASHSLAATLAVHREAVSAWAPAYDHLVLQLRALGVGSGAPGVNDPMPDFALADSRGNTRRLGELLAGGPLVLSFNRGGWCRFCRSELTAWAEAMPRLHAAGGRFAAVSGETGGRAEQMRRDTGLAGAVCEPPILCDVDHGVAMSLGLAFRLPDAIVQRYRAVGLDLANLYGSSSGFLPIPATFLIDCHGIVRFAHVDPDFRVRAEPDAVIARLQQIERAGSA